MNNAGLASEVLDSWKAIAQYLRRDVRTLQRWEATKGLPVRRMPGGERPGVYATRSELDAWRSSRDLHLLVPGAPGEAPIAAPERPTVAVLPFIDVAAGQDDYFADGLADELITALARIPGLRVTARTSCFAFRDREQDIRKIASSLGATAIVEGSVRRSGEHVRVTARLVHAADGCHLWAESYERELTDAFTIQEDISRAIAQALQLRLARSVSPVRQQPSDGEAYRLWLRGRHHCLRQHPGEMLRARRYFEQAAALDPRFARAQVGIAESWWECAVWGIESPREAVAIGRQALARALELDDTSGEAWSMLAIYSAIHDFDWRAAESQFLRARELNPIAPEIRTRHAAYLLEPQGRYAEARAELETALEFDPLSPAVLAYLGHSLMMEGRYGEAIEVLQEATEIDPAYWMARFTEYGAWAFQGRLDKAMEIVERAVEQIGAVPFVLGAAGGSYGLLGQPEKARELLRRLETMAETRYVSPLALAWVYMGLQEIDRCLDELANAVEERDPQIIHLPTKPMYAPLRAHPRFQTLVRKIGLES